MKISDDIINIIPEVKKWRHELHAHPELGYEEQWTSNFVAEKLESFGIQIYRGLGKTGVVGVLKGIRMTLVRILRCNPWGGSGIDMINDKDA